MDRRGFLTTLALGLGAGAFGTLGALAPARAAAADPTFAAFAAARARRPWLAGWSTVEDDALPALAARVHGTLPRRLRGTLYRNGPGRFDRAGFRYRHWFDGDGLMQAWRLDARGVSHRARFVGTPKYRRESAAGRFLVNGAGTAVPGAAPVRNPDDLNAANTAVLALAGRVFALWEGGSAVEVDPDTLATRGPVAWRPDLAAVPFSAHPLLEPDGSVWNVGVLAYSRDGLLVVWRLRADGTLHGAWPLDTGSTGYLHSFAMTRRHLVFVLHPLELESTPDGAFFDSLRWRPERPSLAFVVDKDDPTRVRRHELPSGLCYHWADAREDGEHLELRGCWYRDPEAIDAGFAAMMRGDGFPGGNDSLLARIRLPLAGGEPRFVDDGIDGLEFPHTDSRVPEAPRHLYALAQAAPNAPNYFDAVVAVDRQRERVQRWCYGEHWLVEEHRFVPDPRGRRENDGWLIGAALDWRRGVQVLSVFDAASVERGPLCQADVPRALPVGFHGVFVAA